jgi:predicted dehydrogenase
VEPDLSVAAALGAEFQLPVYSSVEELLRAPSPCDAASIAVPTVHHAVVASQLLRAGIDVLVEKPIATSLEEADALIALAQQHGRVLQVGHLERFNPAILAVRPLVQRPLFFEIHRLSVFTPRSLDTDVVLDLMVHDLDLVLNFVQSPVRELHAVGLPVLSPKIDIANVRIEFVSGCVANFTASRVSTELVRKMRFFQPHRYVSIDYARQDAFCVDVTAPHTAAPPGQIPGPLPAAGFLPAELHHPTPEFAMRKLNVVPGEPLKLELQAFLQAVQERSRPHVSGTEGRAALAVALDILAAIHSHQHRAGLA